VIKVIGIAGPGDPLANEETFETFRLVKAEFPELLFCLSTNGLVLPDRINDLAGVNLHSLTVTINAVDPAVAARIYRQVIYRGRRYHDLNAARILLENQYEGVRLAAELGLVVKVNTVLIPGVNDEQVPLIAERVSEAGAFIMNVMPLIPQAELSHLAPPSAAYLESVRSANEGTIAQFRGCQQCRADAVGLLGGCATRGN
ncbi:MAG TPA: radical SAM protein, partial [Geomonas sp.]|nr:radical SAM protein [Geomonas sp.]